MAGKIPAHMTANNVIASAERLIEVRHFWRQRCKIAEIRVPAWPMPIQNTKFVMPQAQPTGMLLPQTPTPVKRRYRMQNVPKAAKEPVMLMVTHHQSGALFSTIPEIRSEIQAIEWLFRTSGFLGIRSTKA